jgi:hypothetical protein
MALKIFQSVAFHTTAPVNQSLVTVDQQIRHGALGSDEMKEPFGNPCRQIQHRSPHDALRQFHAMVDQSTAVLGPVANTVLEDAAGLAHLLIIPATTSAGSLTISWPS